MAGPGQGQRQGPGRELIDAAIADGRVDTVVLAFPDMHGRPVGKRVTADFFTSHAAEHGMEACDYLLGVDVDMNPLPGYHFTNWDKGYGDFVARPDYSTARLIPWLEGTAFVICDLTDEDGAPVEVSPRRILRRQLERAAERGLRGAARPSSSSSSSRSPTKRQTPRAGRG